MSELENKKRYENQASLLLEVLPLVMSDSRFALKGGTAINLFIRDMPRLSVDIDLSYLPIESREETFSNINSILKNISENIKQKLKGVKVAPSKSYNLKSEMKLSRLNLTIF